MAKVKDKRFRNLGRSVDLTSLQKLNVSQRMSILETTEGRGLLASSEFTAQQLASLFPYNDQETKSKLQSISTGNYNQRMSGDKGTEIPTTLKDRATRGGYSRRERSDPGSVAQLSREQKETFDLLQKGEISADDPRVKFLKDISDADLKKYGISKTITEDGKQSFKADPTKASQMSEEDLTSSVKARASAGGSPYLANQRQSFIDELNNNPELKDRFMRAMRAEAGGRTDKLADVMEATFNRAHMKGHSVDSELRSGFFGPINRGIPSYTNPLSQRERESASDALEQVGQGRNRIQLRTDQGMVTDPGGRVYETMPDKSGKLNFGDGNNYYFMGDRGRNWYEQQEAARQEYDTRNSRRDGSAVTPEQIAAERNRLSAEELARRERGLATSVAAQKSNQQPSVDSNGKPLYIAGDSIGVGVAQSVQGANKVAVGGMLLTNDPSKQRNPENHPINQLKNVPPGSKVQLYVGTNDAGSNRLDPKVYQQRMEEIRRIADERNLDVSIHGPHTSNSQRYPDLAKNVPIVNDMLGSAARSNGFRYVDNTAIQADAPDGIHFGSKGYKRLYETSLQEQEPQAESIPSMPDGGEMNTDADSLQVYKLDKNKLQRDDMVALDDNGTPQFTMNSKEEMKFDPNTGSVEVNSGARGYRNEPTQLGPVSEPAKPLEPVKTETEKKTERESEKVSTRPTMQTAVPSYTEGGPNASDVSLSLTENFIKSPSFERAMARARFTNTGDPALGGNFDFGATNMI